MRWNQGGSEEALDSGGQAEDAQERAYLEITVCFLTKQFARPGVHTCNPTLQNPKQEDPA